MSHVQSQLVRANDASSSQFSVLTRLVITKLNEVIGLQNRIAELAVEGVEPKPEMAFVSEVTYDGVNALFQLHEEFRARSDFKEHMKTWFLGGDVSALPPPPEPAKEEVPEATPETPADADVPEGAQVFGGDYGSANGNEGQTTEAERPAEERDSVHVV